MLPMEWRLRIEDILDAATRAQRYVAGMDLATFMADDRTLDAVSRCFGIIAAHPEIPWAEMRAMRNIVVHESFGVTDETLYKTAREDLAEIVEPLRELLASE